MATILLRIGVRYARAKRDALKEPFAGSVRVHIK
jgi:hypothetical protein